jgi:hypothetical protein
MNLLYKRLSRLCRRQGPPGPLSRRFLWAEAPNGRKNPRKPTFLLKLMNPQSPLTMWVNVSNLLSLCNLYSYASFFCQALMKKFVALGTESAKIRDKRTKIWQTHETSANEQTTANTWNFNCDQFYESVLSLKSETATKASYQQNNSHAKDTYIGKTKLQYKVSWILCTIVNRVHVQLEVGLSSDALKKIEHRLQANLLWSSS